MYAQNNGVFAEKEVVPKHISLAESTGPPKINPQTLSQTSAIYPA
jgi:hypothetical protein